MVVRRAWRSWPPARALARNKLRSALTMLGVFIGVAALIAMVAVGQGANAAVEEQIASLGTNLLVVAARRDDPSGVRGGFGSASTLTVADAEAIQKEDPRRRRVAYLDRQVAQITVRQPELEHQHPGRHAELPRDPQLAGGRRAADDGRGRARRRRASACSARRC